MESVVSQQLGELLTKSGKLDPERLERALRLQEENGEPLAALLVQLGFVAERDIANALASHLDVSVVKPDEYPDVPVLQERITPEFLKQAKAIPLGVEGNELTVAMENPLDEYTIDALQLATGKRVVQRVGIGTDIEAAFQHQYGNGASSMAQIVDEMPSGEGDDGLDDIQHLRDLASEAPIIRVVNLLIGRALSARASDIHIEPFESKLKVRYRVDGVLTDIEAPPAHSSAAIISRIKVMANLNIAERRLPQDGRIKMRIEGREIDLRISTLPTMHGESVVVRILDKSSVPLDFPTLGFTPDILPGFQQTLDLPHGIVLVTGPTGSGKTTTLYAALNRLNTVDKKILTVEDPVEYQLEGINQLQVKPSINLTFANALRSILRQDPDVIMIGEMRDLETATIAVQAALTGHKVFSTLHTNDAATSVTRLLDMGIEDYLLTSTVNGIAAQRLVRTLCDQCKEPFTALPELVSELGIGHLAEGRDVTLYRARGCEHCDGVGYRGRTTILELLPMSDPIRRVILKHADASKMHAVAVECGMVTMYEHGMRKAIAGVTTVDDVVRVTRES